MGPQGRVFVAKPQILAVFAVFALVCSVATAAEVRVLENLAYKSGDNLSEYEQTRCKLDLYLPADAKDFPTIVWFHGGGLQNGDKNSGIAFAKAFAKQGVAVASANYRLSPKARFPAYIEDAAAATAFVRETIDKHGGSPKAVFVSGHSAGGYLTAMVGVDPRYLAKHNLKPTDLAGLIPVSGQMITHTAIREERDIPRTRPLIDEAAPSYHAAKDLPPMLVIAGDQDLPTRAEENRYFVAALKLVGHPDATYREFAGRDHGTIFNHTSREDDEVARAMLTFIRRLTR